MKMITQFDLTTQEYVEIIHELQKEHKFARVTDIAKKRGVTRSSVSTAMTLLKEKNLIFHENYGQIELTEKGQELGDELEKRHRTIKRFLMQILGLTAEIAESEACKIEHFICPQTTCALIRFVEFIEMNPAGISRWLEQLEQANPLKLIRKNDRCTSTRTRN